MSYIKATDILPQEILAVIQKYVDGEYIYIPRKECNKKDWGENTKIRKEIAIRNEDICKEHYSNVPKKILAVKYYLSEKSIQRIIAEMKKKRIII